MNECYRKEKFRKWWPLIERIEKLESNIWDWACERGLDNSTIEKQYNKLIEEIDELRQAIDDNNIPEIYDAIGDITVVLTIMERMYKGCVVGDLIKWMGVEKENIPSVINSSYQIIPITEAANFLSQQINRNTCPELAMSIVSEDIIYHLDILANRYGSRVLECAELAYNEIKDRKGEMVDGYFIKEGRNNEY